ncbi:MAG: phage minor capsid protein [Eubacteriales bacterium]
MTQLEIQALADVPTGIYQDLEEQLMSNIIQHVQDYGEPIATDTWSMQKLAEIGKLTEENIKIIAKTTGSSTTAMERMLLEVAEEAISKVDSSLQYSVSEGLVGSAVEVSKSKNVTSVIDTLLGQASDITNLCNTNMLYKAAEKYTSLINNITSTANEILNKFTTLAVTGAESRQSALTKCIKEFNSKGIPAFVDSAGREWTPEAYVNMCMRSTSNTMAAEAQIARCDDYEIDLVEVDSHSGARPKCARDQGKIFDRANKSEIYPHWNTSSYGEPDGLLGINCGHHIYPYVEGVSIRRYFPTEDLAANDKLYKETQTQRALERSVRNQKRECMLYDQLGDKDAFQAAAVKLKQKEANLKSYVNSNDELTYRSNRVQVVGYDKSVSASAVAANKKYQKEVAESLKSDTMKSEQLSELGAFKTKLQSDSRVSKDYYQEVKTKYSQGSDAAKAAFNKYVPENSVEDASYISVPIYNTKTKKISMNYERDLDNVRGSGATWFHEHGHMIDDLSGGVSKDTTFYNLLNQDRMSYVYQVGKEQNLKTFDKVYKYISDDLSDMRTQSAVSDLLQGITGGGISGVAGHDLSYWDNKDNITSEAFAHMYEAQFDNERYQMMQTVFPNALKYFEERLGEL